MERRKLEVTGHKRVGLGVQVGRWSSLEGEREWLVRQGRT